MLLGFHRYGVVSISACSPFKSQRYSKKRKSFPSTHVLSRQNSVRELKTVKRQYLLHPHQNDMSLSHRFTQYHLLEHALTHT